MANGTICYQENEEDVMGAKRWAVILINGLLQALYVCMVISYIMAMHRVNTKYTFSKLFCFIEYIAIVLTYQLPTSYLSATYALPTSYLLATY